jgi:cell wall-associated NlpC family hydrolase
LPSTLNASAIANDALRYQGAGYRFGGNPAAGIGNWDCSSFVSWVLGHDLKMSVPMYPNGTYNGTAHGPTALQYLTWVGATSIARSSAASGDLCCWATHIGIMIASNQMISAYDAAKGTLITAIDGAGPTGEGPAIMRRINGAIPGNATDTAASGNIGCPISTAAALVVMAGALSHRIRR